MNEVVLPPPQERRAQRRATGGARVVMAALTHVGCARDHNEDSVSIDEDIGLALVADGVGGQNAGELASSIVSSIVSQQVRKRLTAVGGESLDSIRLDTDILQMVLVSAIVDAHAEVLDVARQSAGRRGMASTVVAALVHGSSAVLGWVGDSSAFLLRDGRLSKPLTKRHTLGAELGNTTDTGSGRPRRVLLTRVVGGTESLFTPEVSVVAVQTGDVLAICSDGVTDMLDPDQLETALSAARSDVDLAAQQVVAAANRAGGEDNISIVLVRWDDVPEAPPSPPQAHEMHAPDARRRPRASGRKVILGTLIFGVLAVAGWAVGSWLNGARTATDKPSPPPSVTGGEPPRLLPRSDNDPMSVPAPGPGSAAREEPMSPVAPIPPARPTAAPRSVQTGNEPPPAIRVSRDRPPPAASDRVSPATPPRSTAPRERGLAPGAAESMPEAPPLEIQLPTPPDPSPPEPLPPEPPPRDTRRQDAVPTEIRRSQAPPAGFQPSSDEGAPSPLVSPTTPRPTPPRRSVDGFRAQNPDTTR